MDGAGGLGIDAGVAVDRPRVVLPGSLPNSPGRGIVLKVHSSLPLRTSKPRTSPLVLLWVLTVTKDIVIVGSSFREGLTVKTHNNTKGLVRGFDVRNGKLLWTFNTIPRPGEFGSDTWENDSWAVNGNTGVWTQITVDEDAGLAYLPVEDPTSDLYGGHRPGNNLFSDSLVAVDVKTGQRKWHFQIVHHPIWDYDLSSAPLLADITVDGRAVKAVALPTKEGYLYVFDRITGQPVWPIPERPVPQTTCRVRRPPQRSRSRRSRRRTRAPAFRRTI